jgi:prevent-host-death family protein
MVTSEAISMSQAVPVREGRSARRRRLGVAEAKAHLSELLRDISTGPTVIHSRGRDLAVIVSVEDFARLESAVASKETGGAAFLERVARLRSDDGNEDFGFEPERVNVKVENPFARPVRSAP